MALAADDESWRVPSLVQELAATVQEPPSRYLIPEQDRRHDQLAGVEMPVPVPTIDLQRLLATDDSADEEASKLRSALLSWGFFLVSILVLFFSFQPTINVPNHSSLDFFLTSYLTTRVIQEFILNITSFAVACFINKSFLKQ